MSCLPKTGTVSEDIQCQFSGIHQLGIEKEVKVLICLLALILPGNKPHRFLTAQYDLCRLYAGKAERHFPASLKFLYMPGICAAGTAQVLRPGLAVDVT